MQLHQLQKSKAVRDKKRVGRGGKRGTYSGKGVKGQKSRAGRKLRPEWRDALKSIPKMRGYRFGGIQDKPAVLNLGLIEKLFADGAVVTPKILLQKKLISKISGHLPAVKILAGGQLKKKLSFSGLKISQPARVAIEKAGGTIKN
jgi:large subunit ribosomal protein L15